MNGSALRHRYLEVFKAEWALWKRRMSRDPGAYPAREAPGEFDSPPVPGELRLFADSLAPVQALIVRTLDEGGFLAVPVSSFTVPALDREILVGERVYRLWDAFEVSAHVAGRSWRVDELSDADFQTVSLALSCLARRLPLREDLLECTGLPVEAADDFRNEYMWRLRARVGVVPKKSAAPRRIRNFAVALGVLAAVFALVQFLAPDPVGSRDYEEVMLVVDLARNAERPICSMPSEPVFLARPYAAVPEITCFGVLPEL